MPASKRFLDRARPALRRFQKVLADARKRDVNESDTSIIVKDILGDVLGYDKYQDVTTELAIKSTFCDIAIKCRGRVQYLLEVKPVGGDLKENHLRQAVEYGSREGIEWILLTNGIVWQAHRIRFDQPISHDLVFEIDLLSPDTKPASALETLYLISKDAGSCETIELFWHHRQATSRFVLSQLVLSDLSVGLLRRQLRGLFPGLKIENSQITDILRSEVLKRETLEGDRAEEAIKTVRRAARKKRRTQSAPEGSTALAVPKPAP